jgi:alpha-maltose-1-phosphate synthase
VDPADPEGVANALSALLADPTRARMMGAAGRKRAIEMFSWDSAVNRLLKIYAE